MHEPGSALGTTQVRSTHDCESLGLELPVGKVIMYQESLLSCTNTPAVNPSKVHATVYNCFSIVLRHISLALDLASQLCAV